MRDEIVRREARTRFFVMTLAAVATLLFLLPIRSDAAQGDCAQPVSSGSAPVATDCLFILGTVVGSQVCAPACVCAPKGTLPPSATDALICLQTVVGQSPTMSCPCVEGSSTSSTRTTVSSTSSTTAPLAPGCFTSSAPACDGSCPLGSSCLSLDQATCVCLAFSCGELVPAPQCYGLCPDGDVCIRTGETCTCATSVQEQCSAATLVATCDGRCPAGSFCSVSNPLSQECECVAIACGARA